MLYSELILDSVRKLSNYRIITGRNQLCVEADEIARSAQFVPRT